MSNAASGIFRQCGNSGLKAEVLLYAESGDLSGLAAIMIDSLHPGSRARLIHPAGEEANDVAVALVRRETGAADRRQGDDLFSISIARGDLSNILSP